MSAANPLPTQISEARLAEYAEFVRWYWNERASLAPLDDDLYYDAAQSLSDRFARQFEAAGFTQADVDEYEARFEWQHERAAAAPR